MANATEFRHQVQQLGKLIVELESMPDSSSKVAAGELVRLLMDMHCAGIARIMEIVFDAHESGPHTIDKLGSDPVVRSLLLLYSLHPEDLQTRVQKSLDAVRPRLRKLNCGLSLISVEDGVVRLQIETTGHACGSTTASLRSMIEEDIYEYAPDVTSLVILDPEEKPSSGFVSLESLAGSGMAHATAGTASTLAAVGGAD